MLRDEYPPLRTNPARDLYKMWYSLVQYHAPLQLRPKADGEPWYGQPAAFVFRTGHSLHVDRDTISDGKKPVLYISGVMKIWPNGHFAPLAMVNKRRWAKATLETYEQLTFIRWGYVNREKALWVQDAPRLNWNFAPIREYPEAGDWQRRLPYLPLTDRSLFERAAVYRLKFTTSWVIVPVGVDDPNNKLSERARKQLLKNARQTIDEHYAIANKRYDWWQRRTAIREGKVERPRKKIPALDRINLTQLIMQGMTVYEPKVGPRGTPPQMALPLDIGKEVVTVGR